MGENDGYVIGVGAPIVYSGDPSTILNIAILAEGYKLEEQEKFNLDAQHLVDYLFSIPTYRKYHYSFNVYPVNIASLDSGAADPTACGGSGLKPRTYLDASYCNGGIRRGMSFNNTLAANAVKKM
ncbi:MAG TPA: M64 family metallopeptidase [Ktedonobacteraceae bacterium]|jgi:hypothetical protein